MKYLIAFLILWAAGLIASATWFAVELYRYNKQDKREGRNDDKRIIIKKRGR